MSRTAPSPGLETGLLVEVPEKHPPGDDIRIEAHVRVEAVAVGPQDAIPAAEVALVIAVDVAASRRAGTVDALADAVGALPDGISYTVLGGEASRCYPLRGRLAIADPDDRRHAAFSVGRITAADAGRRPPGYARWLAGARELFAVCELPVRHLVLITDGSGRGDEDEAYREDSALRTELARCEGEFTADVIALGSPGTRPRCSPSPNGCTATPRTHPRRSPPPSMRPSSDCAGSAAPRSPSRSRYDRRSAR